jgi:hypothetical protein
MQVSPCGFLIVFQDHPVSLLVRSLISQLWYWFNFQMFCQNHCTQKLKNFNIHAEKSQATACTWLMWFDVPLRLSPSPVVTLHSLTRVQAFSRQTITCHGHLRWRTPWAAAVIFLNILNCPALKITEVYSSTYWINHPLFGICLNCEWDTVLWGIHNKMDGNCHTRILG